jgi:hypothetical protein
MSRDSTGGIYTGTQYGDKTFYGFKLDPATGDCTVDVINDGVTPVILPQEDNIGPDDYKAMFWSIDSVEFRFNHSTGHLEMVFLA